MYWIAGPLSQNAFTQSLITAFDMDREIEITAEITQKSGFSFVFHQQNFADPDSCSVPLFLMLFVKFRVISKEK